MTFDEWFEKQLDDSEWWPKMAYIANSEKMREAFEAGFEEGYIEGRLSFD